LNIKNKLINQIISGIILMDKWIEKFIEILKENWKSFDFLKYIFSKIPKDQKLSVNTTFQDLWSDWFIEFLIELKFNWINPENITLEILEEKSHLDDKKLIEILKKVKELWFRIAIDDFPKGYSTIDKRDINLDRRSWDDFYVLDFKDRRKEDDMRRKSSLINKVNYDRVNLLIDQWLLDDMKVDWPYLKDLIESLDLLNLDELKKQVTYFKSKWINVIFEHIWDEGIFNFVKTHFWTENIYFQWYYFKEYLKN
jgi:hypothetical protein